MAGWSRTKVKHFARKRGTKIRCGSTNSTDDRSRSFRRLLRFPIYRTVFQIQWHSTKDQHQTTTHIEQVLRTNWNECWAVLCKVEESRIVSCLLILPCIHINNAFVFHREQQRAQRVFKAQSPMDLAGAANKLSGFGIQLLENVDPNPDNMVCAGIINTIRVQVGCLMRLEPNKQAEVRFTNTFW